ncbi:MAG: hypothetical protein FJW39_27745 [Acidobacteria bacterium]|nr:hypothetical protein [Acidobacteriota bacterium]
MKRQTLHTGIAAAAIWASVAYSQVSLPQGEFQPEAAQQIRERVDVHVALKSAHLADSFLARMAEFEGVNPTQWDNLAAVSMQVAFARLDTLREDAAVASVTVASDTAHELRVLASVNHAAGANQRVATPCEGKGAGALVPMLNAISASHNMSIVCSGGEAGNQDNVIHTAVGGDGAVASVLEGLGDDALVARNIALHTAHQQDAEAWLSAARAAAGKAFALNVAGQIDPAHPVAGFQVAADGQLQLTLNRQGALNVPVRMSVVSPGGDQVLGTTGFSNNAVMQLQVNAMAGAIMVVDGQFPGGAPPVQFALSASAQIQPMTMLSPDLIRRILELLRDQNPNPNPNPKPKECKCEKLEVKRTGVSASAKSTDKGKATAVSVTLSMGGFIQCEKTTASEKCKGTITVSPVVKVGGTDGFATAPKPVPVPVTVDCVGPCTGKRIAFNKRVTFEFKINEGLPMNGTVEIAVTPKCAGTVAGPSKPIKVFVDSTKPTDYDPDKTDSDGDGVNDTAEKDKGTDPNSWESK